MSHRRLLPAFFAAAAAVVVWAAVHHRRPTAVLRQTLRRGPPGGRPGGWMRGLRLWCGRRAWMDVPRPGMVCPGSAEETWPRGSGGSGWQGSDAHGPLRWAWRCCHRRPPLPPPLFPAVFVFVRLSYPRPLSRVRNIDSAGGLQQGSLAKPRCLEGRAARGQTRRAGEEGAVLPPKKQGELHGTEKCRDGRALHEVHGTRSAQAAPLTPWGYKLRAQTRGGHYTLTPAYRVVVG